MIMPGSTRYISDADLGEDIDPKRHIDRPCEVLDRSLLVDWVALSDVGLAGYGLVKVTYVGGEDAIWLYSADGDSGTHGCACKKCAPHEHPLPSMSSCTGRTKSGLKCRQPRLREGGPWCRHHQPSMTPF